MSLTRREKVLTGFFIANFMNSLIRAQIVVGKPNTAEKPLRLYTEHD